ncbi:hypothetical protein, partial [Microbulbifer thermotolerans]|uniref:hypothetical protein n=1 Tax=Microbulbifer thermotolerans TaxID=252514 RepID=UPI0022491870
APETANLQQSALHRYPDQYPALSAQMHHYPSARQQFHYHQLQYAACSNGLWQISQGSTRDTGAT